MSTYDTPSQESSGTDIEDRTRRALERVYSVLHTDNTPIEEDDDPSVVAVVSGHSARQHSVDVREDRCTCEDHQYRGVECAHLRRAKFALGVVPLDRDTLAACDVHHRFAEHAPGPVVATSDGGLVGRESDTVDDDSTDNDEPDSGLDSRVREHVEEHGSPAHGYDHSPVRSEPADLGLGDSTGVQEL